ncbi:hypothetical protein ACUY3K_04810 [Corynebacterium uberis]|uniref:hypothetical protein n=1 Tax=Corynebacterium TaxID=1716 RepID=UPI001D0A5F07|nr:MULTISPECIES: hypothetical protein [Corynebacterium]MCZ9310023.1 hypothetical protein [Corynebacterium sp. c6VSa_13]UDL73773.1 hypothetical protein LH391_00605 [Corynebacterium uberis]UDL75344.1 hypothetical protein LH393_08805 [Corynebacterium uberis]UDL77555.1 hypothetical protein LH394_08785 [Corynebacterium uberis]UDL79842.1 hypothetical protein LH392_09220 [Corynebacterium uberis]
MKISQKVAVTVSGAALALTAMTAPAFAYPVNNGTAEIPDTAPVAEEKPALVIGEVPDTAPTAEEKPALVIGEVPATAPTAPEKPAKLTPQEQADLSAKRLDNAQKGVATANQIVDTLGKLGGLFGLTSGK